jgi:hypothetical protein
MAPGFRPEERISSAFVDVHVIPLMQSEWMRRGGVPGGGAADLSAAEE